MKLLTQAILISFFVSTGSLTSSAQITSNISPVKTLPLIANRLQSDFARHRIYASVMPTNTVQVIDTDTLTVLKIISIGSAPAGMSMSPDGTRLYVALSGATQIGVIDLTSLTVLPSLTIAIKPWQIAAGLSNRLYVSPAENVIGLLQIDATTGATQATLDRLPYSRGFLQISPDKTTLHFGNWGISPSTLERFDVSTATPVLVETSAFVDSGPGNDLKLSHNGQFLCYPNGGGNSKPYATDLIDPTNYANRFGNFAIGAFPSFLTFSPNDELVYEHRAEYRQIYLFDTSSFAEVAILDVPDDGVSDLATDGSGRYLFVADGSGVEVYDLQSDATITVYATVGEALTYQVPIYFETTTATATGLPAGLAFDKSTRTISGTPTEDGTFPVVITASDGVKTVTVNLNLAIYPDARALNISTRLDVETGANVLIAGFIIAGQSDKEIVVRGMGPSLRVAGTLENPTLELYDSAGTLIASNDDWITDGQSYVLINLDIAPTYNQEAALYRVLSPGAYTVIIRGVGGTSGIALAEVYDVGSNGSTGPGISRLANISTRGNVQSGANVMIGGMIIGGTADAHMIIRAIGPSLSSYGVAGALPDPILGIYNVQGTLIAFNNDWKDTQQAEIQASGLAPTNDKESAISISLSPGSYTAIVTGVGGATGVALVEAYNLP